MMSPLKKIPFYLILIPFFFCLHGVSENFGYISFSETLRTGSIILLNIFLLAGLLYLLSKNFLYAAIISFFIAAWYLFFGAIQDNLKSVPFLHSYSVLFPILFILTIVVIIFFRKRPVLQTKWTLYLNILLLIYCVFDGVVLIIKGSSGRRITENKPVLNPAAVKQKPDVYFLLFDEYPGYESLADSFGFKNNVFYETLKKQSFVIMPVFANYSMTPFSMSSVFNMQYISGINNPKKIGQTEIQTRYKEIKKGIVFRAFSEMGFKINNYSIFDVQDIPSIGGNSFILGHSRLLTDKILHNRLIKDIGWMFVTGKYALPAFQKLYFGDVEEYNEKVYSDFTEALHKKNEKPQFVYAHFLMPHQPYFFDSTGKRNPPAHLQDDSTLHNKEMFISYLKYCNNKIIAVAEDIIKTNPSALVIMMSDHGFRYYKNARPYEPYNFNNFCAIRYPEKKPADNMPPFSNVNIFRYLFNENFNQQLPYLKDSICVLNDVEK